MKTRDWIVLLLACPLLASGEPDIASLRKPEGCIQLPHECGMKTVDGGKPGWKKGGVGFGGWNCSYRLSMQGDANDKSQSDHVSCVFMGTEREVTFVTVEASCSASGPVERTEAKFREVATALMKHFGVPEPEAVLDSAPQDKAGKTGETKTCTITQWRRLKNGQLDARFTLTFR